VVGEIKVIRDYNGLYENKVRFCVSKLRGGELAVGGAVPGVFGVEYFGGRGSAIG
jgi:hypothetical protein